jgi:uncharacterized membrane protein YgaE (UPF0421/DUF939 family)
MADEPTDRDSDDERSGSAAGNRMLGIAMALGSLFGVLMIAMTGDAYWIALGVGVGVAIGAELRSQRRN